MSQNFLCLISEQTEVIPISTPGHISNGYINIKSGWNGVGVIFDTNLTFGHQVRNTVKNSYLHFSNTARCHHTLSTAAKSDKPEFVFPELIIVMHFLRGLQKPP